MHVPGWLEDLGSWFKAIGPLGASLWAVIRWQRERSSKVSARIAASAKGIAEGGRMLELDAATLATGLSELQIFARGGRGLEIEWYVLELKCEAPPPFAGEFKAPFFQARSALLEANRLFRIAAWAESEQKPGRESHLALALQAHLRATEAVAKLRREVEAALARG